MSASRSTRVAGAGLAAAAFVLAGSAGRAHEPITSPYTFHEDVLPIVRVHCGGCHAPGGVAPMSLLTHGEAVPWGEAIRLELMAGHMPPWPVASAPGRFRNVRALTARELNVLLTWVSGGTPAGDPGAAAPPARAGGPWPLGTPDEIVDLPEATLAADEQERVVEVVLPAGARARWLRAADLRPGTPAIVRGATITVGDTGPADARERLLALWVPGDHPMAVERDAAFLLPAGAQLVVRVRYRKTWEYERETMTDRTQIGLYEADAPAPAAVQALPLVAGAGTVVGTPLQALAIYPDPALAHASATVVAVRPDGIEEELIAFRARPDWARRYWFREPVPLPRGTRLELRLTPDDATLLPPGALPPPSEPLAAGARVILNVVPAS